jgi:hypothetical protein
MRRSRKRDVVMHVDAPIFDHDLVHQHRSQELLLLPEGKVLETTHYQGCKALEVPPNIAFLILGAGWRGVAGREPDQSSSWPAAGLR